MDESKRDTLPEHFATIEDAAAFWDAHDLSDYADFTSDITAVIDLRQRRYMVALAADLATQMNTEARRQGISTETLINLWLSERLRAA